MTPTEYKQFRQEQSKEALKAMAFFFIGVPLGLAALIALFML